METGGGKRGGGGGGGGNGVSVSDHRGTALTRTRAHMPVQRQGRKEAHCAPRGQGREGLSHAGSAVTRREATPER